MSHTRLYCRMPNLHAYNMSDTYVLENSSAHKTNNEISILQKSRQYKRYNDNFSWMDNRWIPTEPFIV